MLSLWDGVAVMERTLILFKPDAVERRLCGRILTRIEEKGLRIVAISVDARTADADKFLASNPAAFTIAYDTAGDTPRRYGVKAMPTSLLIDPAGRIVLVHAGFRADDRAVLEDAIKTALSRTPK